MKTYSKIAMASLLVALTAMAGCYKAQYKTGLPAGKTVHSAKVTHFAWGMAGGGEQDYSAMCPSGVAEVHQQKTFVDVLLTSFTGALYSPTSVEVVCAEGSASR